MSSKALEEQKIIYIGGEDLEGNPVQVLSARLALDKDARNVSILVGQFDGKKKEMVPFDRVGFNNFQHGTPEETIKAIEGAIKLAVTNYFTMLVQNQKPMDAMANHLGEYFMDLMELDIGDYIADDYIEYVEGIKRDLSFLIAFGMTFDEFQMGGPLTGKKGPIQPLPPVQTEEDEDKETGVKLSDLIAQAAAAAKEDIPETENTPNVTCAGMPIQDEPAAQPAPQKQPGRSRLKKSHK